MNNQGKFLVYKSSAGSGKTYTLVKEYLTIALSGDHPDRYKNILAITFTNKAAAEMKERVTLFLKSFAYPDDISGGELLMFQNIGTELGISKDQLKKRAFAMLQSILHNFSDFNITTIDKFILRIIRSFSFDLQLPYNFEVELDSDALLNQAVSNLLTEAGQNKKLTVFLVNYMKQLAQDDQSWNIQKGLVDIAKVTMNEDALPHLNELRKLHLEDFVRIKEKMGQDLHSYERFILKNKKLGEEKLKEANINPEFLIGKSRTNIWAYFKQKVDASFFEQKAKPKYVQTIEKDEWCSKGFEGSISATDYQDLKNLFFEIENYKSENASAYILKSTIYKNLFQLGLINELEKQLTYIREDQNFIHISEFNKKVAEVVIKQPIPFIYERIGEKFNHYLIDEFQDTSVLQWQNLLPLIENSLAYDNKNLIVGDAKQAIYRWRGGDVDQFAQLPEAPQFEGNDIIQERVHTLKRQFNPKNLACNYRSTREVIEFNNLFFRELIGKLPDFFKPYYAEFEQQIGVEKHGGYAQIKVLEKDNYLHNTLSEILSTITDCKSRGKRLKDIAVLTRKNKELALIAEHLTQHNIPVISSESLHLNQSERVNFLMSVFTLILNPSDLESSIHVCNYLHKIKPLNAFEIFTSGADVFSKIIHVLQRHHNLELPGLSGLSLYESFEELIMTFQFDKADPFIQTFMDVVKQQAPLLSATEFIDFWREKCTSIKIASPQDIDAVSLMTVHKSKGLEFPVVILPFANKKPKRDGWLWLDTDEQKIGIGHSLTKNSKKILDTDFANQSERETLKIMLDELNVVYVALTRAAEELFIFIEEVKENADIKGVETYFQPVLGVLQESEDKVFFYGEKSTKKTDLHPYASTKRLDQLSSSNWRKKIKISFSAPTIWNVPCDSEEAFSNVDPRAFGNLIHMVFAQLDSSLQIDHTMEQFIQNGLIEKGNIQRIKTIITDTLALSPLKEIWTKGKHLVEKEIITADGKSYRPDRIIEHNGCSYLIDFKTGEEKERDKKQIKKYAELLMVLNFTNIQPYLIYTDKLKAKHILLK